VLKDTHRKEYEQQFEIHKKFTETDRMRRVFHELSTNKTEEIHSLITNVFLPKRSYYCRTICGKARTYLAVSIDSLGYYKYNKLLYHELGLEMSCMTEVFYQQQDKRQESDQACANKPERRKLRAEQRLENINKEWQKEVIHKKNGNTYQSAMTAPRGAAAPLLSGDGTSSEEAIDNEGVNKSAVVAPRFCNACQNYGHQRRSSRLCPKNKKSKYYEGKTV
jgi:ribosomal protein L32